jgi:membrane protease YdiL (CAAX protease family)
VGSPQLLLVQPARSSGVGSRRSGDLVRLACDLGNDEMTSEVEGTVGLESQPSGSGKPQRGRKKAPRQLGEPYNSDGAGASFPWLGFAFGSTLVILPLLIVIASGARGPWRNWFAFVVCAGGTVLTYMLLGDPAFARRMRQLRFRSAAIIAISGALTIAVLYAGLTGVAVVAWRWMVLLSVVVGAVALFGSRRDREEPGIADAIGILLVWLPIEFKLLPDLVVPPFGHRGINLVKILMVPFLIWTALIVRRWVGLGYNLYIKRRDVVTALVAFAAFTVVGLPLALGVRFVHPSASLPPPLEILGRGIVTWAFVALPEELLFRGMIQNWLMRTLGSPIAGLVVASLIFGAAHLDNPPKIWRYAMLATLAGLAYGWTYMKTGSSVASSIVHTLVDWVWSVLLRG